MNTTTHNEPGFPADDFSGARIWRGNDGLHIDVTNLPPPDPLVATLRLIMHPGAGDVVIFHNDRDPVHLYAELMEQGWAAHMLDDTDGAIILKLQREKD